MSTPLGRWRTTYAPGGWFALAGPTSVVLLEPPSTDPVGVVTALWEEVLASGSITDLAGRLASFGIDNAPSFAAFFWTEDGMRSLVRGQVTVRELASGTVVASGEGIQTWSEVGLAGVDRVVVVAGGAEQEAEDGFDLPLVVGAVWASSLVLDATIEALVTSPQAWDGTWPEDWSDELPTDVDPVPPMQAEADDADPDDLWPDEFAAAEEGMATELMPAPFDDETDPVEEADADDEADPFDTGTARQEMENGETQLMSPALAYGMFGAVPAAPTPTAPAEGLVSEDSMIMAVVCPYGHASAQNATVCRVCSSPIAPQGPQLLPRPALAVLRAPDGTAVLVDRAVLVGRAPSGERSSARAPRLMTVPSPGQDISRTHLEVSPDGWQVAVTDLGSTNGTVLIPPGGSARTELVAGQPVTVALGSVMELGDGVSVLIDFPQ